MSLKGILRAIGKLTDLLIKGREAGLWQKGKGPNIPGPKVLIPALILFGVACASIPKIDMDCRRAWAQCSPGFHCEKDPTQIDQHVCVPDAEPSPEPTPKPVPSPSPIVPVPSPTPEPSPVPSPSTPPCVTTIIQPSHVRIDRENGPWLAYSPAQFVKDKLAGETYERMYRVVDGQRHDCGTPSEKIQQARNARNWSCPAQPKYAGAQDFTHWGGCGDFCQGNDEKPWCINAKADHVTASGHVIHAADLDGYTGPTCPIALPPVTTTTCPSPSPIPLPVPSPGATPKPGPTPATCPRLARVGGGLFACQNSVSQPKACSELQAGDVAVIDSTHHFGRRTVASCDEPHDLACGGRICDDQTNGTKFTVLAGGSKVRKTGTHQLKIGPLVRGLHRIELCANDDYRDALGQPVDTAGAECTVVEFSVP